MDKWIVYTELLGSATEKGHGVEKWFYDVYSDRDRANEVALSFDNEYPIFHCVCPATEAKSLHIQNLPLVYM